jgi:hypothetical protein
MHLINGSDPDPDPDIFVIDFHEAYKKNNFFLLITFEGTFTSIFKDKKKCFGSGSDDPNLLDPYAFESPGSGSINQRYGSGSFNHQAKLVRKTLIPADLCLFCTVKNYVNVPSKVISRKKLFFL